MLRAIECRVRFLIADDPAELAALDYRARGPLEATWDAVRTLLDVVEVELRGVRHVVALIGVESIPDREAVPEPWRPVTTPVSENDAPSTPRGPDPA